MKDSETTELFNFWRQMHGPGGSVCMVKEGTTLIQVIRYWYAQIIMNYDMRLNLESCSFHEVVLPCFHWRKLAWIFAVCTYIRGWFETMKTQFTALELLDVFFSTNPHTEKWHVLYFKSVKAMDHGWERNHVKHEWIGKRKANKNSRYQSDCAPEFKFFFNWFAFSRRWRGMWWWAGSGRRGRECTRAATSTWAPAGCPLPAGWTMRREPPASRRPTAATRASRTR